MFNQKEAVYNAVAATATITNSKVSLTKEERLKVVDILVDGFDKGIIELSSKQDDIKKYTTGLLNNWLRKDTRLNGGDKYEAKNPGSRSGSSDPVVKNLRLLLKTEITAEQKAKVQQALDARIEATKSSKQAQPDLTVLPKELLIQLGLE